MGPGAPTPFPEEVMPCNAKHSAGGASHGGAGGRSNYRFATTCVIEGVSYPVDYKQGSNVICALCVHTFVCFLNDVVVVFRWKHH
jgi:hypothetical protein